MIDPTVLNSRIPRLGTITVGRGVEATSRNGNTYARPTKSKTLVFHTNDPEVATAVQTTYGGDLLHDSPTWDYDVVTDTREVEVLLLSAGFRQALEKWRAAECERRCDGVMMATHNGRPTNEACLCEPEIARGQERACSPSTIVPCIIELGVERLGVWEVRSNSWGTASAMAGTIKALAMVGAANTSVPAVIAMRDRTTRDNTGQVREVVELHATIARSHQQLAALAGQAAALDAPPPAELGGGDGDRLSLMQRWSDLQARAHGLGLRGQLVDDWRQMFGGQHTEMDTLSDDELAGWVDMVGATVADAEAAIESERAQAAQDAADRRPGTTTPAKAPAGHTAAQGQPSGPPPPNDAPPPEAP